MTTLKHGIEIDRSLAETYRLARQIERYHEFLPGYLESHAIEKKGDATLYARQALVRGKLRRWQSWVRFSSDQAIDFEHAAGPLKGMKVHWQFTPLSPHRTRLDIVHRLQVRHPRLLGWILEKTFFAPRVSEMADDVILGFKKACEGRLS